MKKEKKPSGIKSWAEEDRPREKLLLKGKESVSTAELIAILIRSGNKKESALAVSKKILQTVDHDLNELGRLSVKDLMKFNGIGETKAISIIAALELIRRKQQSEIKQKMQIKSASDVYNVFYPILSDLPHEEFWIMLLNRSNKIITKEKISSGGISGTTVDAKMIFKNAIQNLASTIILCHNHPSGSLKPSNADLNITKQFVKAGKLLDISVLDHIIIVDSAYFSFADEDLI